MEWSWHLTWGGGMQSPSRGCELWVTQHQHQWQPQGVALASGSRDPAQPWPVAATPVMVLGHGVGGHQPHYAASMPGHFPHLDWVPCRHMPCCYLLEFVGNYVDGPSVIGTLKWLGASLLQKSVWNTSVSNVNILRNYLSCIFLPWCNICSVCTQAVWISVSWSENVTIYQTKWVCL